MLGLARRVNARILLASTSEVYGDPKVHPQSENSLIWDDRNLNINWPLDKTEIQLSKKDIDGKSWKQISFFEKKVWEN